MAYLANIRVFVRVYELGSLSAAGRDQRLSPAVVSSRLKELEKHLGVRLFNRTTRSLTPTEHGRLFYDGAKRIVAAVGEAEAAVAEISQNPRGTIHVAAPLGIGRRIIAPMVPAFNDLYPEIEVRLRLSDRRIDLTAEGIDAAFRLGVLEDSTLRLRAIAECRRVLCAAPDYLDRHGMPSGIDDLTERHACLLLRYPGSQEYYWLLATSDGVQRVEGSGRFDCDDGDVLTDWALAGRGIVSKPLFEVANLIAAGRLVEVLPDMPPLPVTLACLYPHKRLQDPKLRLFIDFMAEQCRRRIAEMLAAHGGEDSAPVTPRHAALPQR
ncbi:MAG: LysR family transcriptional regulator [Pseudomonadota bacterium]